MTTTLTIREATAPAPEIDDLLSRHMALMQSQSPAESCHVLSADALRDSGARVFGLYREGTLCGTGALKAFGADAVELKSMHVAEAERGQGLGAALLGHMLDTAREMGMVSVWLETGSAPEFAPARALYQRAGFDVCAPFGAYQLDPLSVFMTRAL